MFDDYFDLITKLEAKQAADSDSERQNIRQDIKRIADRLKKQTQTDKVAFDAAFCYYVAGYYVQSQRLAINAQIDNVHVIQKWIFYFLAKNFEKLNAEISETTNDAKFQDAVIQEGILSGNLLQSYVIELIVTAKIAEGLLDIISFIETGDDEKYAHSVKIFLSCQKLLCKAGEWQVWWWVECLKIIAEEFVENSLWQALKPMREDLVSSDTISKYIVANYKAATIIEFWRTQIVSLPRINDSERCSFCISVPASAGKTKAAELAVLRFLLDYWNEPDKKCVYIAPLRKLCQEVEESFSKVFRQFQPGIVSTFYGGYEVDVFDDYYLRKTRILVVTPEKLDGMLRQYPDLASQIKLVIADEGHLVGNEDPKYRFLLERLIYILNKKSPDETKKSRIILISGVLPNVEDFAELISGSREKIVKIPWRPVDEPQIGNWIWNGTEFITTNPELPIPIPFPINHCESEDKFEEYVVRTAIQCAMVSETMVFSASKKAITKKKFLDLLQCVVRHHPELFGTFEPLPPALKRYPDHPLWENGIAIHHKDVPSEVKREIEKRIINGNIKLLFASPTLAQGVNIPFDSVLIYNLQHDYRTPISDAVFWNVVGRVGRPIPQIRTADRLEAPKVIFLLNKAPTASVEDKQNIKRSNEIINSRGKYEVASPFLDFLNEIRRKKPDLPIANLVSALAEKPNLHDIIGESASSPWRELTLDKYLIRLDNQLLDLLHEVYSDIDISLDWLQQLAKELVDLFVKASVIMAKDLDYIREVVLARLQFIAKNIPKEKRRQDYLLGLPYEDCEKIKQNVEELLVWYQGCIGLFNNNRDAGTANLVNLMNFVSDSSICSHKTKPQTSKQDPLPSFDPNPKKTARKKLYTYWLSGADYEILQKTLKLFCPKTDFSQYQESTIERELPWGVSAITRYLNAIAKERGLCLPADFEYLPSLVKYGANSKVACHLRRLNIPRKYAIPIAEVYISKCSWDKNNVSRKIFYHDFWNAVKSLQSLTDEEISSLGIDGPTIERIQKILERPKIENHESEPEFPPFEEGIAI
jgi:superfamily II DNA/RNA helicase